MLVLTLSKKEKIKIGEDVTIYIREVDLVRGSVSIGFEAPKEVRIQRIKKSSGKTPGGEN